MFLWALFYQREHTFKVVYIPVRPSAAAGLPNSHHSHINASISKPIWFRRPDSSLGVRAWAVERNWTVRDLRCLHCEQKRDLARNCGETTAGIAKEWACLLDELWLSADYQNRRTYGIFSATSCSCGEDVGVWRVVGVEECVEDFSTGVEWVGIVG